MEEIFESVYPAGVLAVTVYVPAGILVKSHAPRLDLVSFIGPVMLICCGPRAVGRSFPFTSTFLPKIVTFGVGVGVGVGVSVGVGVGHPGQPVGVGVGVGDMQVGCPLGCTTQVSPAGQVACGVSVQKLLIQSSKCGVLPEQ